MRASFEKNGASVVGLYMLRRPDARLGVPMDYLPADSLPFEGMATVGSRDVSAGVEHLSI
jgi:hypothetical protein